MSPFLNLQKLLKLPTEVLETGLNVLGEGARALQTTIEGLSGQGSYSSPHQAPLNGPRNLDGALAEFANQLVRLGRTTRPDADDVLKTVGEAVASARRSFGYIDTANPRALALSLALPLSAGGLMAEAMLRGLVFFSILGPKRFPKSTLDFMESTSDLAPFVRLQYKDLIERSLERLNRVPDDAATRRELGRLYIKCGRYEDAVVELRTAGSDPAVRGEAMYDACVAWYRLGKFATAIEDGVAAMTANPQNERARYWLWLAAQKLGDYPASVPAAFRMELMAGMAPTVLRYENIAARIGLNKTSGGRGTAIFDYNNDGLLDIAITSAHGGTNLYRNNGDGSFTDVSIESGLDKAINGFSIIAGDYDNDGFTDLYVTRLGWYAGDGTLFHNNGDGTFTDVTAQAGLDTWGPCFSASWVDYDCDGYLDLFIPNNAGGIFDRHVPNRLFHNNGDGTFTDVTAQAGVGGMLPAIGSSWGDYNNDGYPDLFVSGMGHAQLLRNNGDGTFADVSAEAGFTDLSIGTVCAWCDYDNDGWLDVAQFVWSDYEDIIQTMKSGSGPADGKPFRIYHNNRDGTFTKKDRELGLDGCWGSMSGAFGDLDNDGNIDFVLGNGAPPMDRIEPLVILQSDGAKFHNVTFSAGLPFTGKSHGTNCADLFGDGRLSIIVASGGLYPGDLMTSAVFCPRERTGNYLNVRLKGTTCNRDAIGARITLLTGDSRQMREVGGGANFGCLPTEQHFGLGERTEISALEIRWPGGDLQRVDNPPVNATIRIVEGEPCFESVLFPGLLNW
ncbi:MAG: FG-GAP-like repeat-containing protein [Bryobacteraceae bacterium]